MIRMKGASISSVGDFPSISGHGHLCISPVFGVYLVAFRRHMLVVAEVVLLSVGPLVLAGLGFLLLRQSVTSTAPSHIRWRSNFRGYGRFWLAFVVGIGAQVGLVIGFLKLNPNVCRPAPFKLTER